MFATNYPLFERGRLLKIEMLEALRDFPRDLLEIYFKDSPKGILTGCEIKTEKHHLVIEPGIILYNNLLFILKEPYEVPYLSNNRLTLLKVRCLDTEQEKDFKRSISQIYLDYQCECKENEIELCRFKLKEGARLRSNYVDFQDLSTEYDTVNRLYVPYIKGNLLTFTPEILSYYVKELLNCQNLDPIDIQFCYLILQNEGVIAWHVVEAYLKMKGERVLEPVSKEQAYGTLSRILQRIKQGGKAKGNQNGLGRGILLD